MGRKYGAAFPDPSGVRRAGWLGMTGEKCGQGSKARDDGGEKGRKSENDGSAGSWRILLCKRTGAGRFRFLNGRL